MNQFTDILTLLHTFDYTAITRFLYVNLEFWKGREFWEALFLTCAGTFTVKKIQIKRNFKPKKIKKVFLPPELTMNYSSVDEERFESEQLKEQILLFIETVLREIPQADLTNFYNNLHNVAIDINSLTKRNRIRRKFKLPIRYSGLYYTPKNKIDVDEYYDYSAIYHELFHMASSLSESRGGKLYVGFKQVSKLYGDIAMSINEGYTQLLSERYFGHIPGVCGSYQIQTCIAELLEMIIGEEKMTSLYLNSNLYGLVYELQQYASIEDIKKFISEADCVHNYLNKEKLNHNEIKETKILIKKVFKFLMFAYTRKLDIELKNKNIDEDEYILLRYQYFDLMTYVTSGGHSIFEQIPEEFNIIFPTPLIRRKR